jgi:hypothetical protein
LIKQRGGPAFVVMSGYENSRALAVAKADAIISHLGLTDSPSDCARIRWTIERLHLHAAVEDKLDGTCRLGLRADDKRDMVPPNMEEVARVNKTLAIYGMSLQALGCERYTARIGDGALTYQWCPLDMNFIH